MNKAIDGRALVPIPEKSASPRGTCGPSEMSRMTVARSVSISSASRYTRAFAMLSQHQIGVDVEIRRETWSFRFPFRGFYSYAHSRDAFSKRPIHPQGKQPVYPLQVDRWHGDGACVRLASSTVPRPGLAPGFFSGRTQQRTPSLTGRAKRVSVSNRSPLEPLRLERGHRPFDWSPLCRFLGIGGAPQLHGVSASWLGEA